MNKRMIAAVIVVSVWGCSGGKSSPAEDLSAPPTDDEVRWLGPDAYNEFYLTRWRKCTRYASDNTCFSQFYGGDGSSLD